MQRFIKNLGTVAAVALISTVASLAMAKGGHSAGGHSSGHVGGNHSSGRSTGHTTSHHTTSHHTTGSNKNTGNKTTGNKATGNKTTGNKATTNKTTNKTAGNKTTNKKTGTNKTTAKKTGTKKNHKNKKGSHHRHGHRHDLFPSDFWFEDGWDSIDDAAVAQGGIDVAFAGIQKIDDGDSANGQAPAYRVTFTNNSSVDINQPFDVSILASTDGKLSQGLPFAAMRIEGLAAGATSSVDIRFPSNATDFNFVHTIIDSQSELPEANKANNVAVASIDAIQTVSE